MHTPSSHIPVKGSDLKFVSRSYGSTPIVGWELKLLNKLKKIRQGDSSLEVQLNKLNSKVVGQKVPKKIEINPKKRELNWAPEHVDGETSESVNIHNFFLREESLKSEKFQEKEKIASLMSLTYSFRREMINNKIKVSDLMEEYPIFFQITEQFQEFQRLTAVPMSNFFNEVMEQGPILYEIFVKKKKSATELSLLESFKKEIKDLDFLERQKSKSTFGIFILPFLLKEVDCIFKAIPDDDADTPEIPSPEPKIYGRGSLMNGQFIIYAESIYLAECSTFLEAVPLLFTFFYTLNISYPPEAVNTLKFLKNSVLKIHGVSIPPKVRTLMCKISK